jgi:hypothetical protein
MLILIEPIPKLHVISLLAPKLQLPFWHYIGFGIGSFIGVDITGSNDSESKFSFLFSPILVLLEKYPSKKEEFNCRKQ